MKNKTLFFGRRNCPNSKSALDFLNLMEFDVQIVWSEGIGFDLGKQVLDWHGEYIFCFRSYYILQSELISRAKIAAINFHPGPPEYPGSGCINFALYENSNHYGVTAHLMEKNVDSGAIVKCDRYPIFDSDNVDSLLIRTHQKLLCLFYDVVGGIRVGGERYIRDMVDENRKERWSGPVRKMRELDKLQSIDKNISKKQLLRVIRATNTKEYPTNVIIHGKKFQLMK